MPRVYKRKSNRQTWTPAQLIAARHEVNCGMSVNATAAKYRIPRSTLIRRIVAPEMPLRMGPKETVFTVEQERELVRHLLDLESRFYGITQKDVLKLAFELAERNSIAHPFSKTKKMAGRDWLFGFQKRNPEITFRKPEATSAARARGFNKPAVHTFFDLYEKMLEDKRFSPSHIYNADETGISTVPPKKQKIAALKGKKQVGSISSAERGESTFVMMCMSATGQYLPPFMIFPRARMNEALKKGAPAGTKFRCNTSGYMTAEVFLEWFDHFLEFAKPSQETPVLLVLDGHSSHTKNLGFAEKARMNFVTVLVLPAHCSNKMQPLDVAFMGPFKNHYANAAEVFLRQNPGRVIGLYDVAELMGTAFIKAASTNVAVSGFRTSGIWPCNRNVFPDESYAPSKVTNVPEPDITMQTPEPDVESIPMQPLPTEDNTAEAQTIGEPSRKDEYKAVTSIGEQTDDSGLESSFNVTPLDILPLPKIVGQKGSKRKHKAEKSVEITSDAYRQKLAEADAAKEIKLIKKKRKPAKRAKPENIPEDTLCDQCGLCFVDSVDGSGWSKCFKCANRFHVVCHDRNNICNNCF